MFGNTSGEQKQNPQVSTTFTAAAYAANALCGLVAVLPQVSVEWSFLSWSLYIAYLERVFQKLWFISSGFFAMQKNNLDMSFWWYFFNSLAAWQVIINYRNKSTGQLSFLVTAMTFGGYLNSRLQTNQVRKLQIVYRLGVAGGPLPVPVANEGLEDSLLKIRIILPMAPVTGRGPHRIYMCLMCLKQFLVKMWTHNFIFDFHRFVRIILWHPIFVFGLPQNLPENGEVESENPWISGPVRGCSPPLWKLMIYHYN